MVGTRAYALRRLRHEQGAEGDWTYVSTGATIGPRKLYAFPVMIVVLFIAVAGLVAGFLAGGSVRNFDRIHVHWWGAALTGLLLQVAPLNRWLNEDVAVASLIASYGLLVAFMWVNRRLPAAPLLLAGLALNMLVIGVNRGMPVSEGA